MKNKISKDDIAKLAKLSLIKLTDKDIDNMLQEVSSIIDYASRLINLSLPNNLTDLPKNINITREDIVVSSDANRILACAPQLEDRYFEVPVIINN